MPVVTDRRLTEGWPAHPLHRRALWTALVVLATTNLGEALCDMESTDGLSDLHLYYLDDCGVPARSPHIEADGVATFPPSQVAADERARTVAFGWKEVRAVYTGLDPGRPYTVAVTYSNEAFNDRVQTLHADGIELHGPHDLPKGGAERLTFPVPPQALAEGVLRLSFGLIRGPNAVVACVELWTDVPPPAQLHILDLFGLWGPLTGTLVDGTWQPVAGAQVTLRSVGDSTDHAQTLSDHLGRFTFDRGTVTAAMTGDGVELTAFDGQVKTTLVVPSDQLAFDPIHYVPIPVRTQGLLNPVRRLDGEWRLHLNPDTATRSLSLTAEGWHPIRVPGQWAQQGYRVAPDSAVAMATEFEVPAEWAGRRVFIRFDAIHAGTDAYVNGAYIGHSERLFTPVEWEITRAVRYGRANRLDLTMVVATLAEELSYSSQYAFHNLGGIDRSVWLFAVPTTCITSLRLDPAPDPQYQHGLLSIDVQLEQGRRAIEGPVTIEVGVKDPDGRPVAGSPFRFLIDALEGGRSPHHLELPVPDVRLWSAEKPNLYHMSLALHSAQEELETVTRDFGFRRIEIRGSQLYVNGQRVKLAGACRHEIDPLSGRADTACHAVEDVWLMKRANLNMIRTAHYPPTRELLDAADRIGMYVEVEAPFCWVGDDRAPDHLRAYLDPTAAMVDYHGDHPSVLLWSVANESSFNPLFEVSARLLTDLDPTRPTTFNNPDPQRICDIANLHYPLPPYDSQIPDDPRPLLIGEYNFPVCHEQTDVRVNPGLRELWGAGHADPSSPWGRECASSYDGRSTQPGVPPGTWDSILLSDRVIGGHIWAAIDDTFYMPGGESVGYSWHHGFWGLVDAWRRPKPEWWLTKMIYSPLRFARRTLPLEPGQRELRVPISNRFSFTDLSELRVTWELRGRRGEVHAALAPGADGELLVPLPEDAAPGDELLLRAYAPLSGNGPSTAPAGYGDLLTVAAITLGERRHEPPPAPVAGPPQWQQEGRWIRVSGQGFSFRLDTVKGTIRPWGASPIALRSLPMPHVTRFDFGDLGGPDSKPYAVLPTEATRSITRARAYEVEGALEIEVVESYDVLEGTLWWRIDREGMSRLRYDYTYRGDRTPCRELGIRMLMDDECQRLSWRRWSEWGPAYPEDSISRTEGVAWAHRDPSWGYDGSQRPPRWPWSLDETEHGTADFRSVKLCVYEACLERPDGPGVRVRADADAHVRASLTPGRAGTWLHVLSTCRLGPVYLSPGDHVSGACTLELTGRESTPSAR